MKLKLKNIAILVGATLISTSPLFAGPTITKISTDTHQTSYQCAGTNTKLIVVTGHKHADIVTQNVDAIVNAANTNLDHAGGVAAAIRSAAGEDLQRDCQRLGIKPRVGQAVTTPAYNLEPRIKHIIHAVGPLGSDKNREKLLANAYTSSLKQAEKVGATSIAFPAISTAIFGYDIKEATPVALKAVADYMSANPKSCIKQVRFLLRDPKDAQLYTAELDNYATGNYTPSATCSTATSWLTGKNALKLAAIAALGLIIAWGAKKITSLPMQPSAPSQNNPRLSRQIAQNIHLQPPLGHRSEENEL